MKQKPFLLNISCIDSRQLPHVEGRPARDIHRARGFHQVRQVERRIEGAVRIGRRDHRVRRGRCGLPAGHGVNQVVDADDLQIHIAAGGVNQVIAADGEQVAIARVHHDVQLGIGQLQVQWRKESRGRAWCGTSPGSCIRRRGRCSRCRRRWTRSSGRPWSRSARG